MTYIVCLRLAHLEKVLTSDYRDYQHRDGINGDPLFLIRDAIEKFASTPFSKNPSLLRGTLITQSRPAVIEAGGFVVG
jgi:hypothetical protein